MTVFLVGQYAALLSVTRIFHPERSRQYTVSYLGAAVYHFDALEQRININKQGADEEQLRGLDLDADIIGYADTVCFFLR